MDFPGGVRDFPDWAIRNYRGVAVFFPGTRKRNCKKIFLAADNWGHYRRRVGNRADWAVLLNNFMVAD